MAHLVCPMCSETLSEEGSHFFKHFKYKRYACGENDCTHQFYTEAERNAHCSANNHKRSFQKTVNPYIDRMITQLVEDAKHLATTNDMEVVIANRWERRDSESHSEILKTSEVVKQRKKRVTSSSSTTPVTKKTRTTPAVKISTSPFAFLSSSSATSGAATSSSSNINPPTPPTPSPTNTVQPAPSSSAIVDSTTSDHNIPVPPAPPAPSTTRKPRNQRQSESCSTGPHNQTYEEMSALDKLIGWFDPNVPERQDAAKIKCSVCHKEIVYDYIIRKGHVTRDHMAADIAPQDYDGILKTTMDRCYPEMPNSSLACQLCMTGSDVRKTLRREHIEKFHTTSLPPLTCPMDGCGKGFRRQCDLSSHMKEIHKAKMSIHKDQTFQNIRRRRNGMINEMINKCFPWSSLEAMENKAIALNKSASTPSLATPTDLSKDVRIRDANKTRRAPQYNTTGSSSSSSSSDSEDESTTLATVEDPNGTPIDFSRDVIYICHQFNAEVAQKLSQRIAPMLVKREARAEDVVLNDEPMEEEPEDVKEEEEQSREEMEVPKVEDVVQSPQVYGNGARTNRSSPYEPIVPPPSESPPDPLNSRVESSAVYSTDRSDYRSPSSRSSRPPSRTPRSPTFYQPRRSNSRSSTTSYHRNRPYNPSHNTNPRGYSGASSSSSSRHYQSSYRSGYNNQNSYSTSSSRHRGSSEYNSRSSNSSQSWRSSSDRRNDNRNNSSGNGYF